MSKIKAMVVVNGSPGPTIEQREVPAPVRGRGEVLIDVRAASVNRADLAVRVGTHGGANNSHSPTVIGLDCAGVVIEADSESGLSPGDRVMTLADGGFSQRVVVDARLPIVLPDAWSFEMGAAAVLALMTGHNALRTAGRIESGHDVLVDAARSGVGQMTVRIARELGAGRIVAAARTLQNEELLRRLGADVVVESGVEGFVDAVLAATDGKGADLIVDHVGGPYLPDLVAAAAVKGRIVSVGRLGGGSGDLDLEALALKRLEIIGVTFRTRTPNEKADIADGVRADLGPSLASGRLDPVIDRVLDWDDVLRAQEIMSAGSHLGKIVASLKVES